MNQTNGSLTELTLGVMTANVGSKGYPRRIALSASLMGAFQMLGELLRYATTLIFDEDVKTLENAFLTKAKSLK